nr:MAG TPA: hypothetical protein [Caudoviricetes sp.]
MLSMFVERFSIFQWRLRCGLTIYPYLFYYLSVSYSEPLSVLPR